MCVCAFNPHSAKSLVITALSRPFPLISHPSPFETQWAPSQKLIERSHKKTPPFSQFESDKGFKDTLLWLSLVNYFIKQGEDQIVFVTDDKGFLNNRDALIDEFFTLTGKQIKIQENSYYKTLTKSERQSSKDTMSVSLPDVSSLRDQIEEVFESIRITEFNNHWGDSQWEKTYGLSDLLDVADIEHVMKNLTQTIKKNIFSKSIPANFFFAGIDKVYDGNIDIDISNLEEADRIYKEITEKYPDYIQQFFQTIADLFNRNYVHSQPIQSISDDDLPF
jgi:hypothetical protein